MWKALRKYARCTCGMALVNRYSNYSNSTTQSHHCYRKCDFHIWDESTAAGIFGDCRCRRGLNWRRLSCGTYWPENRSKHHIDQSRVLLKLAADTVVARVAGDSIVENTPTAKQSVGLSLQSEAISYIQLRPRKRRRHR